MSRSISQRARRLFFFSYAITVILLLITAWLLLEKLEAANIEIDKQANVEYFLNRGQKDKVINSQSATLIMTYLPANTSADESLPVIFNGLPNPYEGEREFLGKEYLVIIGSIPEGSFYIAKDLSLFEEYELVMVIVLLAFGVIAITLGYVLSGFTARLFSSPVEKLANDIASINDKKGGIYLSEFYKDKELNEISSAFNEYARELQELFKRERSLISMASHELRTPVAVVMGAAEVIRERNQLQPNDLKTLNRILASSQTMANNIQALLSVVREQEIIDTSACFSLPTLVEEIIDEIAYITPNVVERISLEKDSDIMLTGNRDMTRILIHNLLSNALNHNSGEVKIKLTEQSIEIWDQGIVQNHSSHIHTPDATTSAGLGLYIVTLICEKLNWHFKLHNENQSTLVRVSF